MGFATRADLLARCNARRLAQLAVPADMDMVPDDALRDAIEGRALDGYTAAQRTAINMALDAMDKALADADALLASYGIPAAVQTTLLARLASTVAWYYLQGAERMTDDVLKAYEAVIDLLTKAARGLIKLVPGTPSEAALGDVVEITSRPPRFAQAATPAKEW